MTLGLSCRADNSQVSTGKRCAKGIPCLQDDIPAISGGLKQEITKCDPRMNFVVAFPLPAQVFVCLFVLTFISFGGVYKHG